MDDKLQQLGEVFEQVYSRGGELLDEPWQVARAIKARRGRTTLQDVAIKAGVSSNTVGRVETDGGTLLMAQSVAAALGYELKFLLVKRG